MQTAHFSEELSVDLSAYKFTPASESVGRYLYKFNGSFTPEVLPGAASQVSFTFQAPYHYDDMVIEVEMRGLEFNANKLPADWDNWRELGNDVYAFEYKPSGPFDLATINLVSNSTDCSITLQSQGYETETYSISATQTIRAGKDE